MSFYAAKYCDQFIKKAPHFSTQQEMQPSTLPLETFRNYPQKSVKEVFYSRFVGPLIYAYEQGDGNTIRNLERGIFAFSSGSSLLPFAKDLVDIFHHQENPKWQKRIEYTIDLMDAINREAYKEAQAVKNRLREL